METWQKRTPFSQNTSPWVLLNRHNNLPASGDISISGTTNDGNTTTSVTTICAFLSQRKDILVLSFTAFLKGIGRLLLLRFFRKTQTETPQDLIDVCVDSDLFSENTIQASKVLSEKYDQFKESIRTGYLGKTAQFWLIYLDLMKSQHGIHI